jgi:hypothetical protein
MTLHITTIPHARPRHLGCAHAHTHLYHNFLKADDHDRDVIDPTTEPSTLSAKNLKDKGKNKHHLDDISDDEDLPLPKATKLSTRKKEKRAIAIDQGQGLCKQGC